MKETNFEVYNLITLFLDDDEIASLGRLVTGGDADIRHATEEEGVELRYVYYLTMPLAPARRPPFPTSAH
ncbi:hypothetical protein [Sinorhizobium americanum]|uniref:hypothetical protein n=1 Tax=Sinorhizobium americanum TaxID=194963 RepID=UPI001046294D|nr:hypothetical protein [Sinorhizobium americanum]